MNQRSNRQKRITHLLLNFILHKHVMTDNLVVDLVAFYLFNITNS